MFFICSSKRIIFNLDLFKSELLYFINNSDLNKNSFKN